MNGPFAQQTALNAATLLRIAFLLLSTVPLATVLIGLYGLVTSGSKRASDAAMQTVLWGAIGVLTVISTYVLAAMIERAI